MVEFCLGLDFIISKWWGFPGGSVVKNPLANAGDTGDMGSITGSRRPHGENNGNILAEYCMGILHGKSHGLRSLKSYSLWDHKRVGHDLVTKQRQQSNGKGRNL